MRYERVSAIAFGPFREEELELAPGMNVIYGPNEAGKSSWHAALYAGLCGLRRAMGQPKKEDKEFAERHCPWDRTDDWKVGAIVLLEKIERRVQLRHDLVLKTGSAADADLPGHDYSHQIIYEGAVDGSRWLGLNRQAFRATACVRQADILGVRESSDFLQDALQKAVAGAPKDATAATALNALVDYRKQHVGTPLATKKPLSQAKASVGKKQEELKRAREKRDEYRQRRTQVEQLVRNVKRHEEEVAAVKAVMTGNWAGEDTPDPPSPEVALAARVEGEDRNVAACRAVLAERKAQAAESRFARARKLDSQFPDGAPQSIVKDDDLAVDVTEALTDWRNRPRLVGSRGPSVELVGRMGYWLLAATLVGLGTTAPNWLIVPILVLLPWIIWERSTTKRLRVAHQGLAAVASKIGIAARDPARLATELKEWREARKSRLAKKEDQLGLWGEYQGLLDGYSLEDRRRRKRSSCWTIPCWSWPMAGETSEKLSGRHPNVAHASRSAVTNSDRALPWEDWPT